MKCTLPILFATSLVALSTNASALLFDGDTTGGPTFNRPVGEVDYPLTPDQVTLSFAGNEVPFEATRFTVSLAGNYDFKITSAGFDTYIALYDATGFDPSEPLLNVMALNDDGPDFPLSDLTGVNLQENKIYTLVTTGYSSEDYGAFKLSINGPGTVTVASQTTPVPEPTTALFGVALLTTLGVRRVLATATR